MSGNQGSDVEFEMLQAMYDFNGSVAQTLSFDKDDLFVFHSSNNIKKNWWNVINKTGKNGYIPSNYVQIIKVGREPMIAFLEGAMAGLGRALGADGQHTERQVATMQELIGKKQVVETARKLGASRKTLVTAQPPATDQTPATAKPVPNSVQETVKKRAAPSPPTLNLSECASLDSSPQRVKSTTSFGASESSNLSDQAVYLLVQQVREETGLSFELARVAVGVVAEGLACAGAGATAASVATRVTLALRGSLAAPPAVLMATGDAAALNDALSHLAATRHDAQQRSWHLWDDAPAIIASIATVSNTLENADPEVCRLVLKSDQYRYVTSLLEYYQMEERWAIRSDLLDSLTAMCSLDVTIVGVLLNSVLPMELAREMMANIDDLQRVVKAAKLLTMIFSTGEPMPITHIEHLGIDFILSIIDLVEKNMDEEDIMLSLLLSYNLQFTPRSTTNITVQALTKAPCVKLLSEKLLLLLNREEDPVSEKCASNKKGHHSVLKLFIDLFSNEASSDFFYTNDIKVLVDILARQLSDLSPHCGKRTNYLVLCKLVMLGCDKITYEHRLGELTERFSHILTEESPAVEEDQMIVEEIKAAKPEIFAS